MQKIVCDVHGCPGEERLTSPHALPVGWSAWIRSEAMPAEQVAAVSRFPSQFIPPEPPSIIRRRVMCPACTDKVAPAFKEECVELDGAGPPIFGVG